MRRFHTGLTALLLAASSGCYQESDGGDPSGQGDGGVDPDEDTGTRRGVRGA
jgi:hypothetical protein